MPFTQGQSGNPKGRPKQTKKQKKDKEQFISLLHENTVSALESIIEIANTPKARDRFKACRYIIDKAYGNGDLPIFDESDNNITIRVVKATSPDDKTIITDDDWDDDEIDEW